MRQVESTAQHMFRAQRMVANVLLRRAVSTHAAGCVSILSFKEMFVCEFVCGMSRTGEWVRGTGGSPPLPQKGVATPSLDSLSIDTSHAAQLMPVTGAGSPAGLVCLEVGARLCLIHL